MEISGGCHCGAVRFTATVPATAEVLECNCSICAMTGYVHLIVPHGAFRLLAGEGALAAYRFGTRTAEHLFCATCGIKSFYQPRSHPEAWSVNVRALDAGHGLDLRRRSFDGRNWEAAHAAL